MEPIFIFFFFLTIYAHVHLDFLCDIFLSISTSVRRKLAWDIFWHDLPLEGPKVNLTLAHLKRRFTAWCACVKRELFFVSWLWRLVWVTINRPFLGWSSGRKWIFLHWTPTLTLPKLVCHEKCDSFITSLTKVRQELQNSAKNRASNLF